MTNKELMDKILSNISEREISKAKDYSMLEMRGQDVEHITMAWIKGVLLLLIKKGLIKEDL